MTKRPTLSIAAPFRVLPSYERVLQALGRFEHLTAEQTRRLMFGAGSLTYVQARYKQLADAGYVLAVPLGRPTPHGSGPLVYSLDRRGRAYLNALGVDAPARLRQSEERSRSSPHLRHSLAVVDVLILCDLLCRQDPRVSISRMVGERELKARPVVVTLPGGATRGVALDAWLDLRLRCAEIVEQRCLGFEVDGGTEWQVAWRRKVAALVAFERGAYGEAFGVESLTIVVVAPDEARRRQLCSWTEHELAEQGALPNADLWRFGSMPRDLADAVAFFRSPRWATPRQNGLAPLIEDNEL
ncbi:MAG: replication-relaxation family protein [Chloroflexota bacterium]|nr:replication-relaxation family protein [Chloroflexota bacterium]